MNISYPSKTLFIFKEVKALKIIWIKGIAGSGKTHLITNWIKKNHSDYLKYVSIGYHHESNLRDLNEKKEILWIEGVDKKWPSIKKLINFLDHSSKFTAWRETYPNPFKIIIFHSLYSPAELFSSNPEFLQQLTEHAEFINFQLASQ